MLKHRFKVNNVWKPDDGLAPSLFNLVLEYITGKVTVDVKFTI